jgi:hypothetical protein
MISFSKGKCMSWVYAAVNRDLIKPWSSNLRYMTQILWSEGVSLLLIVIIGRRMDDAGRCRGVVAHPGHGGDSPKYSENDTPNFGFQHNFLLRPQGDAVNPFCSPWDGDGWWWWLVVVWLLPQAWATVCRVSVAPPVMGKAPTAAVESDEAPEVVVLAPEGV